MDSSKTRKNYYSILGLKPDASTTDINAAYKKLSTEWHPDKHKGNRKEAEVKFHDICDEDADRTFERFFEEHGMED